MKFVNDIFIILLLILQPGCGDEALELNEKNLVGVWSDEDPVEGTDRISRIEYHFKNDRTVEILRIEITEDTRTVLGYRFRSVGNFKLDENELILSELANYGNDDTAGDYSAIEDLQLISQNGGYRFVCRFEKNGRQLVFTFPPCGPFENCISSLTFGREP